MINYNPRDWFTFIFRFHKADTFRELLPLILGIAAYSSLIAYLEIRYFHLGQESHLKNIPVMHTLLGFAISMLLLFRTSTAYDRLWEGRKHWGSLVNNSRNLAIKLNAMLPESDNEQRTFFRKGIPAFALHHHLRAESTRLALFDNEEAPHAFKKIDKQKHVPNQVTGLLFTHVNQLYKWGRISGDQFIILNAKLQSFNEIAGACERIKNTPIQFLIAFL